MLEGTFKTTVMLLSVSTTLTERYVFKILEICGGMLSGTRELLKWFFLVTGVNSILRLTDPTKYSASAPSHECSVLLSKLMHGRGATTIFFDLSSNFHRWWSRCNPKNSYFFPLDEFSALKKAPFGVHRLELLRHSFWIIPKNFQQWETVC